MKRFETKSQRKSYIKPEIEIVSLQVKEMVLATGCKSNTAVVTAVGVSQSSYCNPVINSCSADQNYGS